MDTVEYQPMVSASVQFQHSMLEANRKAETKAKANQPIRSESMGTLTWAIPQLARFATGNGKRTTNGSLIYSSYQLVTAEAVWHYFRTAEHSDNSEANRDLEIRKANQVHIGLDSATALQATKRSELTLSGKQVAKRRRRARKANLARSKRIADLASSPTIRKAESNRIELTEAEAKAEAEFLPERRNDTFAITAEFSETERKAEQAERWKRNAAKAKRFAKLAS